MGVRVIYLIRNGQYDRDALDPVDELSAPLTDIGRQQAQLTGRALSHLPIRYALFSPYQQMFETMELITAPLGDIERQETHLLRQYDSLSQVPGSTLHPDIVRHLAASQKRQLEDAFTTFFSPVEAPIELHGLLICHANIIRDLICRAIGVSPESWAHMMINHCGISTVAILEDSSAELVGFNDVKHLPEELRTEH